MGVYTGTEEDKTSLFSVQGVYSCTKVGLIQSKESMRLHTPQIE